MDPRDTFPRPPPSPGETLSNQGLLQWVFEKNYEIAQNVAALLANQSNNKADIIEKLRMQRVHYDQRMDDLKNEIFPRFDRQDRHIEQLQDKIASAPSKPEAESSLAKSLFGSIGVGLFQIIPWKHLGMMLPAILIAIAGHVEPVGTKRLLLALAKLFGMTAPT